MSTLYLCKNFDFFGHAPGRMKGSVAGGCAPAADLFFLLCFSVEGDEPC